MEKTFAEKINAFNEALRFDGALPERVSIMNPFKDNACASPASEAFYNKYYNDSRPRLAILGINPGRFGAGITGVPFTDPIRLKEACGIEIPECPRAREPSSVFVYEIIGAYGGVREFYRDWYINSVCPLGFLAEKESGKWVNFNYYDTAALKKAALPFITRTLPEQIACGLCESVCFCFGKDKNYKFLSELNDRRHYFGRIIPLDHPRFIVQYKSRDMKEYARRYAETFKRAAEELPRPAPRA